MFAVSLTGEGNMAMVPKLNTTQFDKEIPFQVVAPFEPMGDQPQAIEYLSKGIEEGKKFQTLLGVTGSGKTFTMANIIEKVQKPTLVLAHNKTLARTTLFRIQRVLP